jgi:hypothetical protein
MAVYDSAAAADLFYDEETVKRFRPLARRRFRTSRPFLVLIRTRNPWVRRRRRRFGWNVRFMISDPLQRPQSTRRNLNSSEASTGVSIRLQRGSASIRVQIRPRLSAFRTVCYSRLPCRMPSSQGTARRSATRVSLGLPPSFPQLWKKMWKSQGFRPGSTGRPRWHRGFHGAKAQNRPVSRPRDVIAG